MDTITIARLAARYRLPAGAKDQSARLDRVLREMCEETLTTAIGRLGIPEHEEVCIRRIAAPVRVRLAEPDASIMTSWSLAIADNLAQALGDGRDVVRYGSRAHALIDMLEGVAAGDLSRAWAWRMLGLWGTEQNASAARAAQEVVFALTQEPAAIVGVLREAARAGALQGLRSRISEGGWVTLARAALTVASLSPALIELAVDNLLPQPSVRREAERIAHLSLLTAIGRAESRTGARHSLAVLAILEAEPSALGRSDDAARALIAAFDAALYAPSPPRPAPERVPGHIARPCLSGSESSDTGKDPRHTRPFLGVEHAASDRRTGRGTADELDPSAALDPGFGAAAQRARLEGDAPASAQFRQQVPAERPVPVVRRRDVTRLGGLLFLLHIVGELDLPRQLVSIEPLARRPLRWSLHALAMNLAPMEPGDPAALAFAGLLPEQDPPSRGVAPATEEDRDSIATLTGRIAQRLCERMRRSDEPASAVLREVCLRSAEIVADPGWIEVHFSLDDVSTEVRRAALDLDLGWLPWLGVIVRFIYA